MTVSGDFYTTDEAARLLGVTTRRIRQMLVGGPLQGGARGLVDAASVDRYRARTGEGQRTRAWAEHTAWGAIAMLSEVPVTWLGGPQTSRLRTLLDRMGPQDLIARTRDRAQVRTYRAHPAAVPRLRDDLVVTDSSVLGLVGGAGPDGVPLDGLEPAQGSARLRGYCPADRRQSTVRRFGLHPDAAGNVVLLTTAFDVDVVSVLAAADLPGLPVLTALDAAESSDPRERATGTLVLQAALERRRR